MSAVLLHYVSFITYIFYLLWTQYVYLFPYKLSSVLWPLEFFLFLPSFLYFFSNSYSHLLSHFFLLFTQLSCIVLLSLQCCTTRYNLKTCLLVFLIMLYLFELMTLYKQLEDLCKFIFQNVTIYMYVLLDVPGL